jgi:hypothetical protein
VKLSKSKIFSWFLKHQWWKKPLLFY